MDWRKISEDWFLQIPLLELCEHLDRWTEDGVDQIDFSRSFADTVRWLAICTTVKQRLSNGLEDEDTRTWDVLRGRLEIIEKRLRSLRVSPDDIPVERIASFWRIEYEYTIDALESQPMKIVDNPVINREVSESRSNTIGALLEYLNRRFRTSDVSSLVMRLLVQKIAALQYIIRLQGQGTAQALERKAEKLEKDLTTLRSDYRDKTLLLTAAVTQTQQTNAGLNQKIGEYEKTIQDKISDSERGMVGHVMSLVGVFSAITMIIMSLVQTSTSWLNSADEASALLAFVVPNAVAILASVVLLSFLGWYWAKDENQRNICARMMVLSCALVFLLGLCALCQMDAFEAEHSLHIIPASDYTYHHDDGMVEFQVNGRACIFSCGADDIHNQGLYYCSIHDALE